MTNKVTVALGSNIAEPPQQIAMALTWLQTLAKENSFKAASLYVSPPMGPQDQPDFYNTVCQLQTSLTPEAFLAELQAQELRQHRQTTRHWGERSIDLDLILYNDEAMQTDSITLPHPGLADRLFVLVPLCEIAPDLLLPCGQSVKQFCQTQLQCQAQGLHPERV